MTSRESAVLRAENISQSFGGHGSLPVQAFPSSHSLSSGVNTQPVAGTQVSVVHATLSSHTNGVPGRQSASDWLTAITASQLRNIHTRDLWLCRVATNDSDSSGFNSASMAVALFAWV